MDHHCPWVGNCIGHKNHKYFIQFLVYTTFGNIYATCFMGLYSLDMDNIEAPWEDVSFIKTASSLAVALAFAI